MRLESLSFSYSGKTVMDSFTLDIPGEGVTAISGPSGCGKTTLLRLLAGLETPEGGRITAPPPSEISMLFQENRLLPGLTPERQLRAVLPKGADVLSPLTAVGLAMEARAPLSSLSGGMLRRVALARALAYARGKALLILDEPFTGVDSGTAASIMGHIRSLRIPVVMSAHDSESLSLADSVIYLEGPPLRVK